MNDPDEPRPKPDQPLIAIQQIQKWIRWVIITILFLVGSMITGACYIGIGCICVFNSLRQRP